MSNLNRRQWLQKSAFTASLLALGCRTNFEATATSKPFQNGLINTSSPLPLHWNENPFGPSKKAVQAVAEVMAKANRYLDQTLAAISDKTKVVFICNPNNPTSTEVDNDSLKAFCRAVPKNVLVFVDEAYIEYSKLGPAGSMIPLVNELPNLMICRTFSKAYGMAGLRLGYAISSKAQIDKLKAKYVGVEFATGWPALVAARI